jgi:hypothetical protein
MTAYVDEETRQRLIKLTEETHEEAISCAEAGAYLAACVMIGSAVEGALLTTVATLSEELRKSGQLPDGDPLRWSLGVLIKIATQAGVLPTSTLGVEVGDAVDVVKWLRNLVHPGAFVRETPADFKVDEETFQVAFDILDEVYEATLAAVEIPPDST